MRTTTPRPARAAHALTCLLLAALAFTVTGCAEAPGPVHTSGEDEAPQVRHEAAALARLAVEAVQPRVRTTKSLDYFEITDDATLAHQLDEHFDGDFTGEDEALHHYSTVADQVRLHHQDLATTFAEWSLVTYDDALAPFDASGVPLPLGVGAQAIAERFERHLDSSQQAEWSDLLDGTERFLRVQVEELTQP